ncbi:MAG: Secretion protein HlyD [Candidatus Parcubacteria bacterium]|nr:Secretion protein HlyD [Candidatus Parcubacteria bacterium]
MKSILSKPALAIGLTLVIAIIIAAAVLPTVGQAPSVGMNAAATSTSGIMNVNQIISATSTYAVGQPAPVATGTPTQLAFPISGRIAAVNVRAGDTVNKGQVLASLDTAVAASAVAQAKASLDLAKAQYGSISLQYTNAKAQQDTLVNNAYRTLLSSGLQARPIGVIDESHNPTISGTYTCGKEGSYQIDLYASGAESGYSFNVRGLEQGNGSVTYGAPQPLGTCGLFITFVRGFGGGDKWTVEIPNTQSPSYQANRNAYDLAVSTRQQTLSQLGASIGQNGSDTSANTASASVNVAESAYQAALAQYANNILVAPGLGTVTFIDSSLKVGQSVSANQRVITISTY